MTDVHDLAITLEYALQALPHPAYRRAMEKILFEELDRLFGAEMSPEHRDLWDRTVALARTGIVPSMPFDPDGIDPVGVDPDRINPVGVDPDLRGLIEEWDDSKVDPRRGLHGTLGAMQVYIRELSGEYPPYETTGFIGYPLEQYPDPPLSQAHVGLINLTAEVYAPVDSPAGDEIRKCLHLVEALAAAVPDSTTRPLDHSTTRPLDHRLRGLRVR